MKDLREIVLLFVGGVMLIVAVVGILRPDAARYVSGNPEVWIQLLSAALAVGTVTMVIKIELLSERAFWVTGAAAFAYSLFVLLSNEPVGGILRVVTLLLMLMGLLLFLLVLQQKAYKQS